MTLQALTAEVIELKQTVQALQAEVRWLRRGNPRADANSLETLLEYLHDVFALAPWTSNQVFEQAEENPLLYAVVVRCLGPQPTIQGLSKLLMQSRGHWGVYTLRSIKRGSSGTLFGVQQCNTPAQFENGRVKRIQGRRS